MRTLTFLVALIPCAVLAAQDGAATPAPEGEVPAAVEAAPPADAPTAPTTTSNEPVSPAAAAPAVATEEAPALVEPLPLPLPPPPPPATAPYPRWGLFLGAGVPQAATLSLIYRPVPLVRLHAGPSWGYLKFGYHGGVTLTPIRWAISPTLGVEAGRFASIDVASAITDPDPGVDPLLRNVDVTYAAALLGFEFGSQRGFCFDLRLGLTWLKVDSKGTGTFTGSGGTVGTGGTTNDATIRVTNPTLRATAPTVQLGLQYFF
jgi:hypothetical protein